MKAATGIAFSALDQNSRVGFHTLWENATLFTNVKDFTPANKQAWFTNAYKVVPNGGTPLPDAMWRVGELFAGNLAGSTLPGRDRSARSRHRKVPAELSPAVDRRLLELDARRTRRAATTTGRCPRSPICRARRDSPPGSNFPRPYYEGPTSTSDSARATSRCTTGFATCVRRIADKVKDSIAPWQHVNVYGLSIGARGTLNYPNGINAITSGSANWPAGHRRRRTGSHRRPVARGRQQPRQVLQCEQRAAARGKHRQRARRLHRPVRHGDGRRHRRRPAQRDQPVRLQDELRSRHLGRRQEVRDRHRHRRAARRRQRQPAQRSVVVRRDAARRAGGGRADASTAGTRSAAS